jgi:hypothetical protein
MLTLLIAFAGKAAFADDNNLVFIDQGGEDNSGQIEQIGEGNQLGTSADSAFQNGYYNLLELTQDGLGNHVGMSGTGLNQEGFGATPSVFNRITITQTGDNHSVGEVLQDARGDIPLGANRIDITQNRGSANEVASVIQEQADDMPGQVATLIQTGNANQISQVRQSSLTPAHNGENSIKAEFIGNRNGRVRLSGWALNSGATSGALIQKAGDDGLGANGNTIDLQVLGSDNRFGLTQGGRLNSVGKITLNGDNNEIGVHQDGFENDLTTSIISGSGNNVGIEQWGTNTAYLDMGGDNNDNGVSIFQSGTNDIHVLVDGHRNLVTASQDYDDATGGHNTANIDVIGSDNIARLDQQGSNEATIFYEGDKNNGTGFSSARLAAAGLMPGDFHQIGQGNDISVNVTGDKNLTAVSQTGTFNLLTAVVSGTLNEAVILQDGAFNSASLRQRGQGNLAMIAQ